MTPSDPRTKGKDNFGLLAEFSKDSEIKRVAQAFRRVDPSGERCASVFRDTYDYLYDGQHTGRYRWNQISKTERAHYGSLFEIKLRRQFDDIIDDGEDLDFNISGIEIDCKYSMERMGWMIPPKNRDKLVLGCFSNDEINVWNIGVVRASDAFLRTGRNWDRKKQINSLGRKNVHWIFPDSPMERNVLLDLSDEETRRIFSKRSGQQKLNELFRVVQNTPIRSETIATLAQQKDYMKRVRSNNGSRDHLKGEGFLILSGDYSAQKNICIELGAAIPKRGQVVSLRVLEAQEGERFTTKLDGKCWRIAGKDEIVSAAAPRLPESKKPS
ncbi:NaeI family type II restriction endonuclease [Brevibacterium litoralis]|uniref:NaeI family type II restriction endonuclease n=1 Tax=Brevibacterium litoralis TaxID=3138935 RepID=UPI0032EAC211